MSNIEVKKLHSFSGHNDSIYSLEKMDDSRFFSSGGDGLVVLWNLESPDEGEVIVKTPESIYAMAFDQGSNHLLIGQNNSGIHKVSVAEKKEVKSIEIGKYQIFALKLHEDRIWAGLSSGEVVILSSDLEVLHREKYASDRARSIDFADGEAAVAFSDNTIKIIDTKTFEVLRELKGHKNSVFTAKYHPSGKYLLSGSRDAQLKVWDTSVSYVLRESIEAHLYSINDVTFRADGKYFVSGSMDKSIKLWDALNFKLKKVLDKHRHAGHGNSVNKLIWMNYRDLLVTCSDDRTISIWEIIIEE
ncbi:MAG: WD40 repeat domain-containing protein [Ekhidna sp.]